MASDRVLRSPPRSLRNLNLQLEVAECVHLARTGGAFLLFQKLHTLRGCVGICLQKIITGVATIVHGRSSIAQVR
jgi:hypothetical protein